MPSGKGRQRQSSPDREDGANPLSTSQAQDLTQLVMRLVESQQDQIARQQDQMTQLLTTLASRTAPRPTLTKLHAKDDVEAYLTTFERQMRAFNINEDEWSLHLAPQLTGRAQQAYAVLDVDEAADYETVKAAILLRLAINTNRQRLRAAKLGSDETAHELRTRLLHYVTTWLEKTTTKLEILDALVLEQLYASLPTEVARHVRQEDRPDARKAAALADSYRAALASFGQPLTQDRPRCTYCGKLGHSATDCMSARRARSGNSNEGRPAISTPTQHVSLPGRCRADRDSSRITCFRCGEQSHVQRACKKAGANFCGTPHSFTRPCQALRATRFFRKGLVDGKVVEDICIDTGCSQTLVHSSLVSQDAVLPDETVKIQCAHGDITCYPLADVELVIDGMAQEIRVGVTPRNPCHILSSLALTFLTWSTS